MKIPFTQYELKLRPATANQPKRGLAFGKFFQNAPTDYTGMRLSVDLLYSAYRTQGDVYACVRELREGVGRMGYRYFNEIDEEVEMPEIDYILNSAKPWRQLKSETIRDKKVCGNAFWALIRNTQGTKVVGLQRLDPRTMSIVATEHGDIVRYIQKVGGTVVVFNADEIVHFKNDSDPQHEVFGFSPLESVIWDVRTDVSATISNYAFFQNDAQPAAYYLLDPDLSEQEQNIAIDNIEKQFKGAENRHKSGVLAGVKDIKTVSVSQKDMEFLLGRRFVTEKVCAAFGVPKFMLGYTDDVNYQNSVSLLSIFSDNTIAPEEQDFAEQMNVGLFPLLGYENIRLEFNPQNIAEEKELETRALQELQMGILTPRQYKQKTRQQIELEDENNVMFDKHIVYAAAGARLLEDIGTDPLADISMDIDEQNV